MSEKLSKIKSHIIENKNIYIASMAGILVGAAGMKLMTSSQSVNVESWKFTLLNWKSPTNNVVTTTMARRGHPGNMVQCVQTGEVFASVRRAAEVMNLHRRDIFNHLHGEAPDVKGYTFKNLGEA
jgi:hypothetical protein